MDKQNELEKLEKRAFDVRIPMYKLCKEAGVAASTISRWRKQPGMMTAGTLRKLEAELDRLENDPRS